MPRSKFSRFHLALLMLTISVGINFLQGKYINTLLDKSQQTLAKGKLAVGVRVPALEVSDLAGVRSTLLYSAVSKPPLLYVFRPSCVWCQRNAAALKALTDRVSVLFEYALRLCDENFAPGCVGEASEFALRWNAG